MIHRIALRRDAVTALLLAALLSLGWAWRDWKALAALRLPDTDDVMRLQQIRDWIAGQAFADLAQHRLAGGLPMHWSRVADLVPGAMIAILTPLIGRHNAELAAVIAWPALLFAAALFLVGRIARALGGRPLAGTAIVVAGIAYPATTIFLPGRIDHHGLQVVLLLGAMLAAVGMPDWRRGAAIGACAGLSLAIGLETAPLFAMLVLVLVADWLRDGGDRSDALASLGVAAFVTLLLARLAFAANAFGYPGCDGFTEPAWNAAIILTAVPVLLGGCGSALPTRRARAIAAAAVAPTIAAIALARSPGCLAPYGGVDPLLARLWLAQVGEAQSVFTAAPATAIGYLGVMAAGVIASVWQWRATRARGWSVLLVVQLGALAIACVQLRGAYAGAMLAAPALAAVIAGARRHGGAALAGAWFASAGMLYPLAAEALTPPARPVPGAATGDCGSAATLGTLAALPPGTLIAPIDTGAWAIAATRHRVVAAPYHRDNAGNLAVYRLYLGAPAAAAARADAWHVDYVLACAAMPGAADSRTAAAALARGALPGFHPIARSADGATIHARNRLSGMPRTL